MLLSVYMVFLIGVINKVLIYFDEVLSWPIFFWLYAETALPVLFIFTTLVEITINLFVIALLAVTLIEIL